MEKYAWIGPRESDTLFSSIEFEKSITWYGNGEQGNSAFIKSNTHRNKYNHAGKAFINYIYKNIIENSNNEYKYMFYNQLQYYLLPFKEKCNAICINSLDTLNVIRNKGTMRNFIRNVVSVVPFISFSGNKMPEIKFNKFNCDKLILQESISSGGNGTHLFDYEECNNYLKSKNSEDTYIVSPYIKDSIPINVHLVIFNDDCIVFPISHQIIYNENDSFRFMGADFFTDFPNKIYDDVLENSHKIGNELRKLGYRGVCGIDYLVKNNNIYFLEVNPRFQASTFLLNSHLIEAGMPSIQELNIMAFSHIKKPFESFSKFKKCKSYFNILKDESRFIKYAQNQNESQVFFDGYNKSDSINDDYSYRFRIIMNRNISWVNYDNKLQIAPNILPDSYQWKNKIYNQNVLALKIALLNQGVRISECASQNMKNTGMIRQGVFQSVDLKFNNGMIINAPYLTDFSEMSPFEIDFEGKNYILKYYDKYLETIHFDTMDINKNKIASNGTKYGNVTFLATDRLRVHHQFRCNFKMLNQGCKFCNVKPKEGNYDLSDVFEIIDFYLKNVEFRHFLIGGGSGKAEIEQNNIMKIASYIRKNTDKPIYAMCLPPKNVNVLEEYKKKGINEISFNIEIFNREIAKTTMPGKGQIPLIQYENALNKAVELWGRSGNVRSMLVLGMEPIEDFLNGVEWLSSKGIVPIISIFRPVTNIAMREVLPHSNIELYDLFKKILTITSKYNLLPGPSCVPCQNNTLSLPNNIISNLDIC